MWFFSISLVSRLCQIYLLFCCPISLFLALIISGCTSHLSHFMSGSHSPTPLVIYSNNPSATPSTPSMQFIGQMDEHLNALDLQPTSSDAMLSFLTHCFKEETLRNPCFLFSGTNWSTSSGLFCSSCWMVLENNWWRHQRLVFGNIIWKEMIGWEGGGEKSQVFAAAAQRRGHGQLSQGGGRGPCWQGAVTGGLAVTSSKNVRQWWRRKGQRDR